MSDQQKEKSQYKKEGSDKKLRLFDGGNGNRAKEQLRIFSTVVEKNPASVLITDAMGNIEYVNPKFSETTGYSLDDLIGKNPRVLKSGRISNEEYDVLWKTITSGSSWHGKFCNQIGRAHV